MIADMLHEPGSAPQEKQTTSQWDVHAGQPAVGLLMPVGWQDFISFDMTLQALFFFFFSGVARAASHDL